MRSALLPATQWLFLRRVGTLSNLSWLRSLWSGGGGGDGPVNVRAAREEEYEAAARSILAPPGGAGNADEGHVREFARLAEVHRNSAGGTLLAEQGGRVISAVLPVVSPGKTMLLFLPGWPGDTQAKSDATRAMVEQICARAAAEGVHLAQSLLEPNHSSAQSLLMGCGFERLAELLYMQADFSRPPAPPATPAGLRWVTYGAEVHGLFARGIMGSYERSMDCPALNGLRDINDIMAGHRATGAFDPALWFALCEGDEAAAVLLLSRVPRTDVLELVYVGLAPAYRGRGLGDLLMRRAVVAIRESGCARLSLAVDAQNLPALKLYWRHGMQAMGRKVAMIRDLRK